MQPQIIDITQIIDEQKIGWFHIRTLIWSFLIVLVDGYDLQAAGYVGPALVKAWKIDNVAVLGPLFGAAVAGFLIGAPLFGYIGDRFGRKKAIISGALVFGIFSLAAAATSSVNELIAVRFFAGLGIGAVLPLSIVLNGEYAPKRFRATLISVMFLGITFGSASPGPIAAWLMPEYGWQIIFIIGGIVPIIVALCLIFALPESLKYLVLHAEQKAELVRVLRQLKPEIAIAPDTQFILRGEETRSRATIKDLFAREFAYTTVLLWSLFIVNGIILAFVQYWTPTLLATTGIPAGHAALAVSMWQIGGALGGLTAGRAVDKFGVFPLVVLMVVAIPIVATIGSPGLSQALVMTALFAGGFCLIGVQFGINAISGMVYPTFIRSTGVGSALGIARIGGIGGSLMGGYLIAMHMTLQHVYYVATAPILVTIVAASLLARSFVNRS